MYKFLDGDGRIRPNTVCPWKNQCGLLDGCHHKGEEHAVAFSCGCARAFEISHITTDAGEMYK